MIKEYEIKHEPIVYEGNTIDKYNAYYYHDGIEVDKIFYSYDGVTVVNPILDGYTLKVDLSTLTGLKAYLISKVDEETEAGIFAGFSWDGLTFSMSINAQINWSNLLNIPDAMFPMELNSKNDVATYSLSLANRQNFYLTALGHKNQHLQAGNQKKNEINACETLAELQTLKTSWGF